MRRTIAGLAAALVLTTATVQPAHAETTTPPVQTTAGSSLGGDGLSEAAGLVAATGLVAGGLWWLSQQPHIKNALRAALPGQAAPAAPTAPGVHYENCDAVKAAGKAPLYRGQPGYSLDLDGDQDDIACE